MTHAPTHLDASDKAVPVAPAFFKWAFRLWGLDLVLRLFSWSWTATLGWHTGLEGFQTDPPLSYAYFGLAWFEYSALMTILLAGVVVLWVFVILRELFRLLRWGRRGLALSAYTLSLFTVGIPFFSWMWISWFVGSVPAKVEVARSTPLFLVLGNAVFGFVIIGLAAAVAAALFDSRKADAAVLASRIR